MSTRSGFISVPLIIGIVIVLAVIGGGVWYLEEQRAPQNSVPVSLKDAKEADSSYVGDGPGGHCYAQSNGKVYFLTSSEEGIILSDADLSSFKELSIYGICFGNDGKHVYQGRQILDWADPATFKVLAFQHGVQLFLQNKSTIVVARYDGDNDAKFEGFTTISNGDPATFEQLTGAYDMAPWAKDKNNVYCHGDVLTGADPATVTFVDEGKNLSVKVNGVVHTYDSECKDTQSVHVISGMSKYTDKDFGFSFWYPSSWSVSSLNPGPTDREGNQLKGRIVIKEGENVEIDIDKVHSDQMVYNVNPGACGYCGNVRYFFNPNIHTWMKEYPDGANGAPDATPEEFAASKTATPANVSNNTMGGLHMFSTEQKESAVIIPLSAQNFLLVTGVTYTEQCGPACGAKVIGEAGLLARTVVATDPSVATPVSVSEQIKMIQAEAEAYGVK